MTTTELFRHLKAGQESMEFAHPKIVTLTSNPAIDIATSVPMVTPLQKLRCTAARRDPGGGGINVARVVQRLGGNAIAIYPAGGSTGHLLRRTSPSMNCPIEKRHHQLNPSCCPGNCRSGWHGCNTIGMICDGERMPFHFLMM